MQTPNPEENKWTCVVAGACSPCSWPFSPSPPRAETATTRRPRQTADDESTETTAAGESTETTAAGESTETTAAEDGEEGALPDLGGRTVTVAVENAYLPFNYIDSETSEPAGWDYDAWTTICERLNCVPDYQEAAWEA